MGYRQNRSQLKILNFARKLGLVNNTIPGRSPSQKTFVVRTSVRLFQGLKPEVGPKFLRSKNRPRSNSFVLNN
jgi:hypothetical protein